jgi:hypothetical protein
MAGDAKTETSWGAGGLIGNRVLGSLFLTVFTQPVCLAFWSERSSPKYLVNLINLLVVGISAFITMVHLHNFMKKSPLISK